ncbi:1-acyl-sn-glycerol-3-phosphate acyltransferase [Mycobacterium sp. M1]|uniref:1-acyl-sn-glycerol-3-phosphate acyltransferase n=1 Tax=Mycolicibacter acidiphilus TaxID=2835306 RepID=A0ABS5RJF1_9MYCO|nr:1-acyl-sn-glycerol-3-phosphate acyltransferase [Mycolicibacter acidiphilus]MBS9534422.1 1-acyl-sn-glycerol-3-phosphate acyltransferase [Mycolicibacter acidiphilus]
MARPMDELNRAFARTSEGLDGRDPEFIREWLPRLWLGAQLYFRAEVHGFENVPDEPVLFVGNHSGGANIPDTFIFVLAYHTYFTVEGRPLVALAHKVVANMPVVGNMARKFGVVQADQVAARDVLGRGANVLVYPGGDVEALRPWRDRNKIVFDGRKGFLKLAHAAGVKIVPVVAAGGQETFFVLNDGRRLAKALHLDTLLRVKSLPISLSFPWGLVPGDLPHIALPAKIRIQVLPAIDLVERFGDEPDFDDAYGYVTSVMQVGLSTLAAKTVVPGLG